VIPAPDPDNEGYIPIRALYTRHSLVENMWYIYEQAAPSRWGVPKDPCAPDPNRDGRTDYRDLVHMVNVDMGGAREVVFSEATEADGDERTPGESSCDDELCFKA
jgi:hypothetical protein